METKYLIYKISFIIIIEVLSFLLCFVLPYSFLMESLFWIASPVLLICFILMNIAAFYRPSLSSFDTKEYKDEES